MESTGKKEIAMMVAMAHRYHFSRAAGPVATKYVSTVWTQRGTSPAAGFAAGDVYSRRLNRFLFRGPVKPVALGARRPA